MEPNMNSLFRKNSLRALKPYKYRGIRGADVHSKEFLVLLRWNENVQIFTAALFVFYKEIFFKPCPHPVQSQVVASRYTCSLERLPGMSEEKAGDIKEPCITIYPIWTLPRFVALRPGKMKFTGIMCHEFTKGGGSLQFFFFTKKYTQEVVFVFTPLAVKLVLLQQICDNHL